MAVVNLNATGNIRDVMQNVPTLSAKKEAISSETFESVMKGKVNEKGLKIEKNDKAFSEKSPSKDRIKEDSSISQTSFNGMKDTGSVKITDVSDKGTDTDTLPVDENLTEEQDIALIAEELMAGIAQILNITPEELQTAMDSLGLDIGDLTVRDNVASLVLNLNGSSDISDLLVDNGMLEAFNGVNDLVQKTLVEADLIPSDFKAALETLQTTSSAGDDVIAPRTESRVQPEREENVLPDRNDPALRTTDVDEKAATQVSDNVNETETDADIDGEKVVYEDRPVTVQKNDNENGKLRVQDETENDQESSVSNENRERGPVVTVVKQTGENEGEDGTAEKSDHQILSSAKQDRPLEHDMSLTEHFVRNLEMAVEETGDIQENVPDVREIVYQVVDRIRVDISPENTSMEMQLNPENLGRVSINITSKAGVMTAQINTENRQAREAIESQLQILKDNIEAKGIRVEAVEVRVSDFNFADSRNSENSSEEYENRRSGNSRRNRGADILSAEDDAEADRLSGEILESTGSTVSYRA